jgi:hypothetical protein
MKTKIELEQDIILITTIINREFPELSKYIIEMPENNVEEEKINTKNLEEYYQSLLVLVTKYAKTHKAKVDKENMKSSLFDWYPLYSPSEDIYQRDKEEKDLDPENSSKNKALNKDDGLMNELDFEEDMTGEDLDIPGSELDDGQESMGSGDEENNYYSLGGDNYNDLEEDRG